MRAFFRFGVGVKAFFAMAAALSALFGHSAAAQRSGADGVPSETDAPIALLVDISSGQVLHRRDANRRFVPASITKVMTMYLAFDLIEEGKLDPAQALTVSPEIAEEWQGKGSTMFLESGDRVQLSDMLAGIANVSANDAAMVLATTQMGSIKAWTEAMTAKAHALGMMNSHFATPNGWPDDGQTFTTATDLVDLASALTTRHPLKFREFMGRPTFTYKDITQSNYDPLIGRIEGADGIKTGFTNEAGFGYLGTAKRGDHRLVMVLAGVRSNGLRGRLARQYIEWGFDAFDRKRLFSDGATIGEARVQGGGDARVDLIANGAVFVNVPADQGTDDITVQLTYDGPLKAPIKEGEQVAYLEITVPGMENARIPLTAKYSVPEANFLDRIYNGFVSWFA